MKRIALSLALASMAVAASWALVAEQGEKHEHAGPSMIKLDQAPAAVRKAIKKAAGSTVVAEVEKETEDGVTLYEAGWKEGDVDHEVVVNEVGQVMATEMSVSGDAVPKAVRKAAAKHLPKSAKAEFELKQVVLYEVIAMVDGKEVELLVDPSGRVMELEADDEHEDHDGEDEDDDDDDDDDDEDKARRQGLKNETRIFSVRVLVIEDYEPVRSAVVQSLSEDGFAVDSAADGRDGLWLARSGEHDAIVLDIMLPHTSGIEILETLRSQQQQTPVLLLTALDAVDQRIRGLNSGADDYLVKPFAIAELIARVRALVRRSYGDGISVIQVRNLVIDTSTRMVHRDGELIELTAREYSLLELLARRRGKVVTRSEIWKSLYDMESDSSSNVVDVYIGYLRKKLDAPTDPSLIQTRRGHGYLLEATDS